jgi:hypothetical protein
MDQEARFMTKRTFSSLALITIACVTACGRIVGEPIEGTGKISIQGQDSIAGADPSADPYACAFTASPPSENLEYAPIFPILPMECAMSGGHCWLTGAAHGEPDAPVEGGTYDPATGEVNIGQVALCEYFCHEDSDCPAPVSGTASATCWMWEDMKGTGAPGMCLLPCDSSGACPDGFYCLHTGLSMGNGEQMPKACYSYDFISGIYDPETKTFVED